MLTDYSYILEKAKELCNYYSMLMFSIDSENVKFTERVTLCLLNK